MRRRKWFVAGCAAIAILAVAATAGIAASIYQQQQEESSATLAPASTAIGGPITAVKAVRETADATTNSTTYVNVPAASTQISVPSGRRALILARFSGESECDGGSFNDYCSVRILIGGVEAQPADGLNFAFDTDAGVATNYDTWESHSIDRSRVVGAGTHNVRVQWAVTTGTTTFRLDDWSLTVERSIK